MADKTYSDQELVQLILGEIVNQVCKCEMVDQSNIDEMEDYPFVTFNWIDPGRETTADWLGEHTQYNCTMQVDVHATSSSQALQLAKELHDALRSNPYRRFFSQANIMPEVIGNSGNRTSLAVLNYDYDFGFDCTFTVTSGFSYKIKDLNFVVSNSTIDTVKAKENVIGSNTDNTDDATLITKNNREEN